MSRFAADWLRLREPADARARSAELVRRLKRPYSAIVDLGAGTGANLRWLAPRLGFDQRWVLIDNDAELLAAAVSATQSWAAASGFSASRDGEGLAVAGPGFHATMTTRELDMSADWQDKSLSDLPGDALLTASALLDLVSEGWLSRLVASAAAHSASVFFTLCYDGTVDLDPPDDADEVVVALVNRHQLTDKGFGPALGPRSPQVARRLLERSGYTVHLADSSWRCGAGDRGLIAALIDGWAEAAAAVGPADAMTVASWRARRLEAVLGGGLGITVGHRDLAATPRTVARPG